MFSFHLLKVGDAFLLCQVKKLKSTYGTDELAFSSFQLCCHVVFFLQPSWPSYLSLTVASVILRPTGFVLLATSDWNSPVMG